MPFLGILLQMTGPDLKNKNIFELLLASDPVVKVTLVILLFFSIFSWAIIFFKFLQVNKAKRGANQFLNQFEGSEGIDELVTKTSSREGNPLYEIFSSGIYDLLKYRQAYAKDPVKTPKLNLDHIKRVVFRTTSNEITRLEQFIPFLATTASASPFIGLFGTVWGILHAFLAISHAGSTSLTTVGPAIAEALIATAIGLAAAIPAVIAYNYFVNKLKNLSKILDDFSMDLIHRIEKEYF